MVTTKKTKQEVFRELLMNFRKFKLVNRKGQYPYPDKLDHYFEDVQRRYFEAEESTNAVKTQQGCKYCHFHGSAFTEQSLFMKKYCPGEPVMAMGAAVNKDLDDRPRIDMWVSTSEKGYQSGFEIKYCPICGRKLGGKSDVD
jgi:hypothetical protein